MPRNPTECQSNEVVITFPFIEQNSISFKSTHEHFQYDNKDSGWKKMHRLMFKSTSAFCLLFFTSVFSTFQKMGNVANIRDCTMNFEMVIINKIIWNQDIFNANDTLFLKCGYLNVWKWKFWIYVSMKNCLIVSNDNENFSWLKIFIKMSCNCKKTRKYIICKWYFHPLFYSECFESVLITTIHETCWKMHLKEKKKKCYDRKNVQWHKHIFQMNNVDRIFTLSMQKCSFYVYVLYWAMNNYCIRINDTHTHSTMCETRQKVNMP